VAAACSSSARGCSRLRSTSSRCSAGRGAANEHVVAAVSSRSSCFHFHVHGVSLLTRFVEVSLLCAFCCPTH
jgi:hypothetical protein